MLCRSLGTFEGNPIVETDYPRAFFDAVTSTPTFTSRSQPFHHVHLSGAVVESDQTKTLWYYARARKARVIVFFSECVLH